MFAAPLQWLASIRQRIARRREQRRMNRLNRRVQRSDNRTVQELRLEVLKRDRARRQLQEELQDVRRQAKADEESLEHRITQLQRQLMVAEEENRLLGAIHERDIARRESEAAIMLTRARSMQLINPSDEEQF